MANPNEGELRLATEAYTFLTRTIASQTELPSSEQVLSLLDLRLVLTPIEDKLFVSEVADAAKTDNFGPALVFAVAETERASITQDGHHPEVIAWKRSIFGITSLKQLLPESIKNEDQFLQYQLSFHDPRDSNFSENVNNAATVAFLLNAALYKPVILENSRDLQEWVPVTSTREVLELALTQIIEKPPIPDPDPIAEQLAIQSEVSEFNILKVIISLRDYFKEYYSRHQTENGIKRMFYERQKAMETWGSNKTYALQILVDSATISIEMFRVERPNIAFGYLRAVDVLIKQPLASKGKDYNDIQHREERLIRLLKHSSSPDKRRIHINTLGAEFIHCALELNKEQFTQRAPNKIKIAKLEAEFQKLRKAIVFQLNG